MNDESLNMDTFIGQKRIKDILKLSILGAKIKKKSLDHVLLYGNPGLGKTTLAKIISKDMNSNFIYVSAPTINKIADLIAILANLNDNDVLFIDEAHRLNGIFEECIYTAMEEFKLRFIYSINEESKPIEIDLPNFTLICATTKISKLSDAFRSRFGLNLKLDKYSLEDLNLIAKQCFNKYNVKLNRTCYDFISKRSRGSPRVLKNIINRVIDYILCNNITILDIFTLESIFSKLYIFELGLNFTEINILKVLYLDLNCQPVSLELIANILNESIGDLETVYEPYLVELKLIERTKRGRKITNFGKEFINDFIKRNKIIFSK